MPKFRGWIPTITGHLSFSTIGLGRNPKKLFKRFRAADGTRYTVVSQKRRMTDALFGKLGDFVNWIRGREGYSVFVVFGKSFAADGFDEMFGPCIEFSMREYSALAARLDELKNGLSDQQFEEKFDELSEFFVERSGDRPGTVTAFSINRNGAFLVEVPDEVELTDKGHRDIASQVYFFSRDICHIHQHHSPTSDTILDVTKVVPVARGNVQWCRHC